MTTFSDEAMRLVVLGRDILCAVQDGYSVEGITLPERQYLTLGTPANDCEQLVVSWQQSYLGVPGDEASAPQNCDAPRSAVFVVQLSRAMPVVNDRGRSPAAAVIQESSEALLVDAHVLTNIVADIDPFGLGVIVTTEVVEVSGGLGCIQVQTVLGIP